jgi:hypothetical protein
MHLKENRIHKHREKDRSEVHKLSIRNYKAAIVLVGDRLYEGRGGERERERESEQRFL